MYIDHPDYMHDLGEGAQFGEIALTTNNPRSATVKCAEDSLFLTLDRERFKQALKVSIYIHINSFISVIYVYPFTLSHLIYISLHNIIYCNINVYLQMLQLSFPFYSLLNMTSLLSVLSSYMPLLYFLLVY